MIAHFFMSPHAGEGAFLGRPPLLGRFKDGLGAWKGFCELLRVRGTPVVIHESSFSANAEALLYRAAGLAWVALRQMVPSSRDRF